MERSTSRAPIAFGLLPFATAPAAEVLVLLTTVVFPSEARSPVLRMSLSLPARYVPNRPAGRAPRLQSLGGRGNRHIRSCPPTAGRRLPRRTGATLDRSSLESPEYAEQSPVCPGQDIRRSESPC